MKLPQPPGRIFAQYPHHWVLGRSHIHMSLLLTLGTLSGLFLCMSYLRPEWAEFRSVAVTLPVVWCVSLTVRLATQQLSLGAYFQDIECIAGPSGNLSTEYEYLPPHRVLMYGISGQLASLGLASVGAVVSAATLAAHSQVTDWHSVFDFRGGWSNVAWSTQILWVNLFLMGLNFLPTLPFDFRAVGYAWFAWRAKGTLEPTVFRSLSRLDSHLAVLAVGSGVTLAVMGSGQQQDIVGWYAAIAAAVYLMVAGRWEIARAAELERQFSPKIERVIRADSAQSPGTALPLGFSFAPEPSAGVNTGFEQDSDGDGAQHWGSKAALDQPDAALVREADIDEILRKLHREGRLALTDWEHEALLSASRQLNQQRGAADCS